MNLYRVQYYLVIRSHSETVRGQEFHHRTGLEKTAFVVAETQEAAAAHVQAKQECDILGVHVQQKDVEVAAAAAKVPTRK